MRPYVAGLRVDPEDGPEADGERVERRSVTRDEEVVVAQPLGQTRVVDGRPSVTSHLLGAVQRTAGHGGQQLSRALGVDRLPGVPRHLLRPGCDGQRGLGYIQYYINITFTRRQLWTLKRTFKLFFIFYNYYHTTYLLSYLSIQSL